MLRQTPREQRRKLVETGSTELSLRKRCELLNVNRSTIYYEARPCEIDDISLLNEIREIWSKLPFYGYRRITKELKAKGYAVNYKRVQRSVFRPGII